MIKNSITAFHRTDYIMTVLWSTNLDLGSAIHKVLELWNEYDEFIDLSNSYDEYYNMTKDFQNVSEETYNYKLLTHKYLCEAQNYISERLGKM